MNDKEFSISFKCSISLSFFESICYLIIVSIVYLGLSILFNHRIESIPESVLGIITGFVIFNFIKNFIENKRSDKNK
ncbi:hypothetical protein [Clostridioides sp. ZZV15-6597]|uniref:hypothetical protein n=1 Tax=Clostridioides sp. ZZV15-6597 TaxID=2811500 RepID=UPI001D124036|nr:hypothetical protein [Clostridioides sp. ZZV15-6597]